MVVPVIDGKRGNPVVWARRFFPELMALDGDVGARHLIGRYPEAVAEVALTDTAALVDVDTPGRAGQGEGRAGRRLSASGRPAIRYLRLTTLVFDVRSLSSGEGHA